MQDKPGLGALLHNLLGAMVDCQASLLESRGIDIWEYEVLGGLEHGPVPTQKQLASTVGRDKTRLVPVLDRLQARGLVDRRRNPRDHRKRVVTVTDAGRVLMSDCKSDVQAMEAELLAVLDPVDAEAFIEALRAITEAAQRWN